LGQIAVGVDRQQLGIGALRDGLRHAQRVPVSRMNLNPAVTL
jgi:hypothetical protein